MRCLFLLTAKSLHANSGHAKSLHAYSRNAFLPTAQLPISPLEHKAFTVAKITGTYELLDLYAAIWNPVRTLVGKFRSVVEKFVRSSTKQLH